MVEVVYSLGDRVSISGTLEKFRVGDRVDYRPGPIPNDLTGPWKNENGKRVYTSGVVVGKRTMPSGGVFYDPEWGSGFRATKHTVVYLVAYRLTSRPVMCLPTQITHIPS